ncbi:hypothetical protein D3C75_867930 [compost metagenome]
MRPPLPVPAAADKCNIAVAQSDQMAKRLIDRLAKMRPHRIIVCLLPILVDKHDRALVSMQAHQLFGIETAYDDKAVAGPQGRKLCMPAQGLAERNAQLPGAQLNPPANGAVIRVIPFLLDRTCEQERDSLAAPLGIPL